MDPIEAEPSVATESPGITLTAMGICKKVPFYIFAGLIIGTVFVSSYIGLVIFMYCSMLIIFTYVVTMLSYITANSRMDLAQGICWCLFSVPIVEVLVTINWRIIRAYFSKIWHVLSFQGILDYLNYQIYIPKYRCWARFKLFVTALFLLVVFGVLVSSLVKSDTSKFSGLGLGIGLYSVLAPVIAFVKTFYYAWRVVCCSPRNLVGEYDVVDDDEAQPPKKEVSPEERAKQLSLFDPCQLLRQGTWRKFCNSECNYMFAFKQNGKCNLTVIPAIAAALIQVAFVMLDWYSFIHKVRSAREADLRVSAGKYVIIILRTILSVYMMPLVMSGNVTVLFTKWQQLGNHIRRIKVVTVVFYVIVFVVFGIYTGLMNSLWDPYVLENFAHQDVAESSINASLPASMCSAAVGGWSIFELAGLSMIPSFRTNPELIKNVTASLFGSNETLKINCESLKLLDFCEIYRDDVSSEVIAYQSLTTKQHLSVLIESVTGYWFSKGVSAIVPFYSVTNSMFLQKILDPLAWEFGAATLGFSSLSQKMYEDVVRVKARIQENASAPLFTGHTPGGLAAKFSTALLMSSHIPAYSVAFESPTLTSSQVAQEVFGLFGNPGSYYMYNIYSDLSLFSFSEQNITVNIRMPQSQSVFDLSNVYDTFCLIAAGCAETDRYDRFCVETIGRDKYLGFFKKWTRTRNDLETFK